MVHHVGGVARIGVEVVTMTTRDQTLDTLAGLNDPQLEACEGADGGITFLGGLCRSCCHQGNTSILLVGILLLTDGDGELALGIGVHPCCQVLLTVLNELFQGSDVALVRFQTAPGVRYGSPVGSLKAFQLLDISVELHLLHNQRGAGSQCFNLCGGESDFTGILSLTAHILAVHNLVDEVLLPLQDIPQAGVKAALGNVGEVLHLVVDVPLAVSSAVALLHVAGSPRCVQMVNGNDALLSVHTHAHLTGGADQHPDLALVHIGKEFLFLCVRVRFMDEGDLLCRDAALHQTSLDIIVELCALHIGFQFLSLSSSLALALRGRHITEDDLGALDGFALPVDLQHVVCTAENLAALLIRQARVDHALGVGNLSPIAGDFQHVVNGGVHILDVVCTLLQLLHVVLLELARIADHNVDLAALHLRDFQTGNVRQHIGKVAEQELKLAHVLEPGKTLLHTVALAAGLDLHAVDHLAKLLGPGVKGRKTQLIQQIRLQVLLHDVHFAHGVHHRRSGGEHDAPAAVQLLEVSDLGVQVKCSLGAVLVAQARNIGHAGRVEQVLEIMSLVHEDAVYTELLKFDVVLILGGIGQLVDLGLKLLALLFQILDGKALAALLSLGLLDGPDDAVDLFLVQLPCKVGGDRQLLELLIADDDCVIFAVGNAVGENLAVGSGEITCFRHKQFRRREEVHKLIAPLGNQRLRNSEQGLLNQTQLFELHGGCCHLVCFAGADFMCQQGIAARGDDPLHRIPLVRSQRLHGIGAVDSQVVAVVLRGHDGVEGLVVERRQLGSASLVLPQPLLELLLDGFDLLVGRCGGILVHHALAVIGLVLYHHALAVEHGIEQIQEAPAAGAKLLRVGGIVFQVFGPQLHGEVAGICVPGHRNILTPFSVVTAQNMSGEVRVHTVRNPRRTGIHEDILIAHILRHNGLQCLHIPLVVLVHGRHGLCIPQLCPDITGEVDLCRLQGAVAVFEHLPAVQQFPGYILHGLAGELCDQGRIHAAGLVHGYDQTLRHILCRGDGAVRCDGVLEEDVRLGGLLGLRVVVFQGEDGELVGIVLDGVAVGLGVEEAVLLYEGIIRLVQGRSGLPDLGFLLALLLGSLQYLGGIPDLQHTGNTLGGALGGLHLHQLAVLVLVHLSVLDDQAVILSFLPGPLHSKIGFLRACLHRIVHLGLNVLECRPNLVRKAALAFQRLIGQGCTTIHAALHGRRTQNHFRVVVEVIVDVCAVPVAFDRSGVRCFQEVLASIIGVRCSLFQDQNIRHDLSAGVALESSIRKSNCAQQVGPLHDVATYRGIAAIHGIAGSDKHHDAAGSHLVQRLSKEIVVDGTGYLLGIVLVRNGVVAERNVANCHIHEVIRDVGLLKALDAHICIGIQVLSNQTGNAVQLHHRPATHLFTHICRHGAHEVTHAGRRFHHSAAGKAQMLQTVIHGLDDGNVGIMGVQGRTSCAAVFLLGQQFLQLCILLGPVCFSLVEGIGQTAPAHILGKDDLFRLGSIAALCFQLLHQTNGFYVGLVSGFFAVGQIQAVTDHKVTALGLLGGLLGDLLHNILMELLCLCLFGFLHAVNGFFHLAPVGSLVDNNRMEGGQTILVINVNLNHLLLGRQLVDCNSVSTISGILLGFCMGSHGAVVTDICVGRRLLGGYSIISS